MTAILLAAALIALGGLIAGAWWGSNIIFHPPKMLPLEIWPDRFGLAYETVSLRASDGLKLQAWLIPASIPTDKTVILCHGWGDNKGDLIQHTHFLARHFNLFAVDFRQHGASKGCRSTIGCLETRDIEAALEFLGSARPAWTRDLGIYGLSMGGCVAIWAAARHPNIRAVAVEAPYASFNKVVSQWTWNEFRLPSFPCAWITLLMVRLRLGEDPEPYSPLYHVARISPRPILFIAGERDLLMPPEVVRQVYEKAGQPKEIWTVNGAQHGQCEAVAGPEYHDRLTAFFLKHLS